MPLVLMITASAILFLGIQGEKSTIQTTEDAFNVFVVGYYYDGTLIGGIAWKWHIVVMIGFAIINYVENK